MTQELSLMDLARQSARRTAYVQTCIQRFGPRMSRSEAQRWVRDRFAMDPWNSAFDHEVGVFDFYDTAVVVEYIPRYEAAWEFCAIQFPQRG